MDAIKEMLDAIEQVPAVEMCFHGLVPQARAQLAALTGRIADLTGLLRGLLAKPFDYVGDNQRRYCRFCDFALHGAKTCPNPDCPGVKLRAMVPEAHDAN